MFTKWFPFSPGHKLNYISQPLDSWQKSYTLLSGLTPKILPCIIHFLPIYQLHINVSWETQSRAKTQGGRSQSPWAPAWIKAPQNGMSSRLPMWDDSWLREKLLFCYITEKNFKDFVSLFERMSKRGGEGPREREKQAPHSARSWGSIPGWDPWITTRAKGICLTNWATQAPC